MAEEKRQGLISELVKHPAMFGYSFLYLWLILGIFGLIARECARLSGIDLALVSVAPFLGMLVMSLVVRRAPKLASISKGPLVYVYGLLCLLPSLYLFYCDIAAIALIPAMSAVLSFLAGCAATCAFIAWQCISVKLPLNSFILTEGVTTVNGCLVGGLIMLFVPQLLWPLICILAVVLSFGLLDAARVDAEAAPVPTGGRRRFKSDQVLAHIDKRIRILFFMFAAIYGVGWCYIAFTSLEAACIALIFGALCTAVLVRVRRDVEGVSDRFVIHLIRICLAGCALALFLYYLGFPLSRCIALGILVVLWLVFWTIDNSLQLQQAAHFSIPFASYGATSKIVNNAGFALGWILALAAIILKGAFPFLETAVLLGIGILLLILGIWLIPLGAYESPDKMLGLQDPAKAPKPDDEPDETEAKIELAVKRFQITAREREVLVWLMRGRTAKTIAGELSISEATAKTHTYNIYKKLSVHTQQDLITLIEELQ